MPYADIGGLKIFYEDSGGSGPALLFAHGFLMDNEMYAPQIAALRDRYRCIAFEQRGFGRTGPVVGPFSYWDSARDALGVLDHLKVQAATLIGLSQGGFLAMRAALLAPERVKALVLFSTRSETDPEAKYDEFRGLQTEWRANGSANAHGFLADVLIGPAGSNCAPWFGKWAAMSKDALHEPINTLIGRDDLTPRLSEIACPSIVFHGDADAAIDIAHGEALAKALPNNKDFVRVPGAGHAPNLTHAATVNPQLAEFLATYA
jgi:3-oxoadipate enol-lactonase